MLYFMCNLDWQVDRHREECVQNRRVQQKKKRKELIHFNSHFLSFHLILFWQNFCVEM